MSRCACRAKPAALSANNYRSASIKALSAKACGASRRSRGVYYFSVQANELNKWYGQPFQFPLLFDHHRRFNNVYFPFAGLVDQWMITANPIASTSKILNLPAQHLIRNPNFYFLYFHRSPLLWLFFFAFFCRETAGVLLRVITARAVKLLLTQLQELDMLQAQWFNNYCAENPPTEGDKFIADLFNAKGVVVFDPNTQHNHHIDPQNLAHRLLQVRGDMASNVTLDLPNFVKRRNTGVLRTHLERNTFVSGSNDDGYKERRGYIRPARK